MWKLLVFLLLIAPLPSLAKEFILPSGLKVNIVDSEITYYEKEWKPFTLPSGLVFWAETIVHVPKAQAAELDFTEQIKLWIIKTALEYKVSTDYAIRLAACESNFNPEAFNPKDPQGGAHGLFQYLRPTWNKWQKESGIKGNIYDWRAQIEMTMWGLSKNRQNAWFNCNKYILENSWDFLKKK